MRYGSARTTASHRHPRRLAIITHSSPNPAETWRLISTPADCARHGTGNGTPLTLTVITYGDGRTRAALRYHALRFAGGAIVLSLTVYGLSQPRRRGEKFPNVYKFCAVFFEASLLVEYQKLPLSTGTVQVDSSPLACSRVSQFPTLVPFWERLGAPAMLAASSAPMIPLRSAHRSACERRESLRS